MGTDTRMHTGWRHRTTAWFTAVAGVSSLLTGCQANGTSSTALSKINKYVCYYGNDRQVLAVDDVQLLIVDADALGPLSAADKNGRVCLAYLSLGEVEAYRRYWQAGADYLVQANPNWPDAHLVDVRSATWQRLMRQEAQRIVELGYDGLFFDTLDTVESLLHQAPRGFAGVDQAMASLVVQIRQELPQAVLLANRGFAVLPHIHGAIDGVLIEGVRSRYDFSIAAARLLDDQERGWIDQRLAEIKRWQLPVFALDYLSEMAPVPATKLARQLRALGTVPFISTVDLQWYPGQQP